MKRIKHHLPDAKLICILRNPTDRAISHYYFNTEETEPLSFREALQTEEERIGKEWNRMLEDETYASDRCGLYSYKKRGIYIEQIERCWQCFDKKQLLILNSEAFFGDPQKVFEKIFEFLEIESEVKIKHIRPAGKGRRKRNVDQATRDCLDNFFAPYNRKLFEKTGLDFGWPRSNDS